MNYLNLDKEKTEAVAKELNKLLADYSLYYQKIRNFHWNIVGPNFFDLHKKFEKMYEDAQVKVDDIAERILTLGYGPTSNFSDYLEMSELEESPTDLGDKAMVKTLLEDHATLLKQMRKIMEVAEEAEDDGTDDLIGGFMSELEKTSWMLNAWSRNKSDDFDEID